MNIDELLANQQTLLECVEPWPGLDAAGRECTVNCSRLMTVEDAIKFERAIYCKAGHKDAKDRELLVDFLAVNWATVYMP
jgi:hypothetical protein